MAQHPPGVDPAGEADGPRVPAPPRDRPGAARRLGIVSAWVVVGLEAVYLVCLAFGLASLASPDDPIGDPWFTALELLILAMMPFMVVLMVAVHGRAPEGRRPYALAATAFMAVVAGLTSAVHFSVLTLGRREPFEDLDWLLSFTWPSVAYAVDILAWDVFFPLAVLCAAAAFRGEGPERRIRIALGVSGLLAAAGLAGVFLGDMRVRNVGIVGYAVVFPVAAGLMGLLFARSPAGEGGG